MSHISTTEITLEDRKILEKACQRMGLPCEEVKDFVFYDGNKRSGMKIDLPGWRYPIVVDDKGKITMDTYNGQWGNEEDLNEIKKIYGVEKAKRVARLKGYTCRERRNNKGEIEVVVTV